MENTLLIGKNWIKQNIVQFLSKLAFLKEGNKFINVIHKRIIASATIITKKNINWSINSPSSIVVNYNHILRNRYYRFGFATLLSVLPKQFKVNYGQLDELKRKKYDVSLRNYILRETSFKKLKIKLDKAISESLTKPRKHLYYYSLRSNEYLLLIPLKMTSRRINAFLLIKQCDTNEAVTVLSKEQVYKNPFVFDLNPNTK